MSKLVRDKIPEIIRKSGQRPVYHSESQNLKKLLYDKLEEEHSKG